MTSVPDPRLQPNLPPQAALLEGAISIEAALRASSRPVHRVLLASEGIRAQQVAARIASLAASRGVPLERVPREAIDAMAQGHSHGGMVAEVGERHLVPLTQLAVRGAFVVMLDGVEDPYNLGAALRSVYAAGATGLVVRSRSWASATAIVGRSSAGASELLPTAEATDPLAAATALGTAGLRIVAAAEQPGATDIYDADLRQPLLLLIGGERRGLGRAVLDRADFVLRIPYARRGAASLGTAAATAVIGFEVMRQRSG